MKSDNNYPERYLVSTLAEHCPDLDRDEEICATLIAFGIRPSQVAQDLDDLAEKAKRVRRGSPAVPVAVMVFAFGVVGLLTDAAHAAGPMVADPPFDWQRAFWVIGTGLVWIALTLFVVSRAVSRVNAKGRPEVIDPDRAEWVDWPPTQYLDHDDRRD